MSSLTSYFRSLSVVLCMVQICGQVAAGTQFASHVSFNTPTRSFTHGVGDPLPLLNGRAYQRTPFRQSKNTGSTGAQDRGRGYPREKPSKPFVHEDIPREVNIPILPPSPYKVDSPDPESLWPGGLFLPPVNAPQFEARRRSDTDTDIEGLDLLDPYLLEGSEAIAAVRKANWHGHMYFHDIPHIKSLLENQELRTKNKLKPHRLGSIRHTWPYNRP